MLSIIQKIFSSRRDKIIKNCQKVVEKVNELEKEISLLSDLQLKERTLIFRSRLEKGEKDVDILPEAFAVVREASKRLLNMRHYDVQMIGGMLLHRGSVVEMKTGEGKTLSATLPTYLNALSGRVHVITVNDYLAKRDHDWMGRIFEFLGLSASYIVGSTSFQDRIKAYKSDIVYITNSEIGFDYLKDNMQMELDNVLLGESGFNYAIIDEIDSILIDEARTPLIVSGGSRVSSDLYLKIDAIARRIDKKDFSIDEKRNTVQLLESGEDFIEDELKKIGLIPQDSNLYSINSYSLINYILQALKAHYCLKKDKDYIVIKGKVMIIDEFTGRVAEGRRYSGGLHQAIEAKENVEIGNENQTLASITYQNFFRMYKKLSGMTGTAQTEAKEFFSIYNLEVINVPTVKPIIRVDHRDIVFRNESEKVDHIAKLVKEKNEKGQPVLIGTVSIEKSEHYSKVLSKLNIKHNVLNAKNHEKEANIIAEAGRKGAVTIATNMAGRGTDILLGGSIDAKILTAIEDVQVSDEIIHITNKIRKEHESEREEVVKLGGLFVIGSERHESRRVDNQLQGRAGRLGDPGESQFFLSLSDDLLRIFGGDKLDKILKTLGLKENESMQHPMLDSVIARSQKKLEGFHYEIRKNVVRYDDIINEQRSLIYKQRFSFLKNDNIEDAVESIVKNINKSAVDKILKIQGFIQKSEVMAELRDIYKEKFLIGAEGLWLKHENEADEEELDLFLSSINKFIIEKYRKRVEVMGDEIRSVEQFVLLNSLDLSWQEHLQNSVHIREGIHLRAYGQKDPFLEYKKEMFIALEEMFYNFEFSVIQHLINIDLDNSNFIKEKALNSEKEKNAYNIEIDKNMQNREDNIIKSITLSPSLKSLNEGMKEDNNIRPDNQYLDLPNKQSRNAKCNCGSNLKYKNCCGK